MTTHTIHSDRDFVTIKGSNGTWIIAQDASVTTYGGAAISEDDDLHGNKVVIDGDVRSSAPQSVSARLRLLFPTWQAWR